MEKQTPFILQYKDPRWQKKRLQIMDRDNFCCISCKSKDKTLNVHHAVPYRKETKIWEYENDELKTLCEDCHKEISEVIKECTNIIMGSCHSSKSADLIHEILMKLDGCSNEQLYKILVKISKVK